MPTEILVSPDEEKPEHECGLGLIYSFEGADLRSDLFKIGHSLQHRGQNGGGIATDTGFCVTGSGLLRDAIDPHDLEGEIHNHWAMVHLRYGTSGGYGDENMQPVEVQIGSRPVHVAVNGNIPNESRLSGYLTQPVSDLASDTVLAAELLSSISAETMDDRVLQFARLPEIAESANNMFIGSGKTVYVIRDQFGLHPLVMGDYKQGNGVIIASETVALQKIGSTVLKEFPPGAVMKISPDGMEMLQEGSPAGVHQSCLFEAAYFSSPNSGFSTKKEMDPNDWLSMLQFRMRTGEIVSQEHPVPSADFVVGMPDSGVPFSTGLANGMGKPYIPSVIRSHYNGDKDITRTFMQDETLGGIAALVRGKLMPVNDRRLWEGKVVVIGDDSLVRGNTAREVTRMLRQLGVREIHWRYGFPPVQWPCHLGVSFRTQDELLAAKMENDWKVMAAYIGADSIAFISSVSIIKVARECDVSNLVFPPDEKEIFAANGFCGGCVTGVYPVTQEGTIYNYKFAKS